jgi:hypothetical protein
MFPASRINFGKMYTVEHNVKVYDFGDVRKSSIPALIQQWKWVLDCDLMQKAPENRFETSATGEEDDDDDNDQDGGGQLEPIEQSDDESEEGDPPVFPVHGTASYPWNDTVNAGQLTFQKDHRICVTEYVDENWARGRNENTRLSGLFPQNYVKVDHPDYATAIRDVPFDRKKPDRLDFKLNDRILLLSYDSGNWDNGRNLRTSREGKYPYAYVKMDRGSYAAAVCDYPYDAGKPDQLAFKAKDRILVTKFIDSQNWATGRNERTRWEGRFPGSYVKFPE